MEGIPINQEILNQFQNETDENYSTEPGPEVAAGQLNQAAGWLLDYVDKALKDRDERLATDEQTKKLYSELGVLVAKRNFNESVLKNSPELFFGVITAGLLIEKGIVLQQIKREQATENVEKKEKKENE